MLGLMLCPRRGWFVALEAQKGMGGETLDQGTGSILPPCSEVHLELSQQQ